MVSSRRFSSENDRKTPVIASVTERAGEKQKYSDSEFRDQILLLLQRETTRLPTPLGFRKT